MARWNKKTVLVSNYGPYYDSIFGNCNVTKDTKGNIFPNYGFVTWHDCRETFQHSFFSKDNAFPNDFIFRSSSNERIKKFLRALQKKLKLKDKFKFSNIVFGCNISDEFSYRVSNQYNYIPCFSSSSPLQKKLDNYAMRVTIPDWWIVENQQVRFGFLTAFMKSAINASCWDRIFDGSYFKATPAATERFLAGYTHFVGRGKQWVQSFVRGNRIKKRLVLPPKDSVE